MHTIEAKNFLKKENQDQAKWHDKTLWKVRSLRDLRASEVEHFQELREVASEIKRHTLTHLDEYLEEFERNALKNNGNNVVVHWARTALEHNQIVHDILKKEQIDRLIKSKSMLTEECNLNHYLEERGIEVVDSDLGELIVQLRKELPSHIVMPSIHLNREQIGKTFKEKGLTKSLSTNPEFLTGKAREYLRNKFLNNQAGLTGVNFGIAETGGVVVVTNEGNADLGVNLARVRIHSMGIEKLIPRTEDLGVFTRLLSRSATGQPISVYTSHYYHPAPEQKVHIILVDNGRSEKLGQDDFYESLKCIRCGACMNTCPVYRWSGGHSYGYKIPGPIGSILGATPVSAKGSKRGSANKFYDLPFASSLCGSCTNVCPVKINIHEQLFALRQEITLKKQDKAKKRFPMLLMAWVFTSPFITRKLFAWVKAALKFTPQFILEKVSWGKFRSYPSLPKQTFTEWYEENKRN